MEQKFLPIGTVCKINKSNKKVMIIGYCVNEFNGDLIVKDYCGCVYPEGILLPNQLVLFNHEEIQSVNFVGFKTDEYIRLDNLLNLNFSSEENNYKKISEFHKENDMFLTSNDSYSKLLFDENGVVMIAEEQLKKGEIQFDENGYVIKANIENKVDNPFSLNKQKLEAKEEIEPEDWNIFHKLEFDENGVVITDDDVKTKTVVNSEFDDNGILVSEQKYVFDENGIIVSATDTNLDDDTLFVDKKNTKTVFNFDENGILVSTNNYEFDKNGEILSEATSKIENVVKTNNYSFDENGTLVAEEEYVFSENGELLSSKTKEQPKTQSVSNYKFDENGVLVSIDNYKFDENGEIISENTSNMENITKTNNYKFDENGILITEEEYVFSENGELLSSKSKDVIDEIPPIGPGLPGYVKPKEKNETEEKNEKQTKNFNKDDKNKSTSKEIKEDYDKKTVESN